jgi:hypothetical protein
MSDPLSLPANPNGTDPTQRLEAQLLVVARALPYPRTPDLAASPRLAEVAARARLPRSAQPSAAPRPSPVRPARPLAWALAAVLIVLLSLLAVPPVRSGVIEFLRLGAVRILLGDVPTATPAATAATFMPSATPLASVLDLQGQTTLADAVERLPHLPIRLPAYPADLGQPDAVFVQDLDGDAVVLVWLEPDDPSQVRLSLHLLASPQFVDKLLKNQPARVEFTEVNGREAFWTTGPYFVIARGGFITEMRLITGHVLIWYTDDVTYRLETDLPLEEAIKIAESLQ